MFGRNKKTENAIEGLADVERRLGEIAAKLPDLERAAKRAEANRHEMGEARRRTRGDHMIGRVDDAALATADAEFTKADDEFLRASAALRKAQDDHAMLLEAADRLRSAAERERAMELRRRYLEILPKRLEQLVGLEDTDRQLREIFREAAESFPYLSAKEKEKTPREIPAYAGLGNPGGHFEGKIRVAVRHTREHIAELERMLLEDQGRGDIAEWLERTERELGGAA